MDFAVYVVSSLFSSMISSIDYNLRKDFSIHNSDTYLVIFPSSIFMFWWTGMSNAFIHFNLFWHVM